MFGSVLFFKAFFRSSFEFLVKPANDHQKLSVVNNKPFVLIKNSYSLVYLSISTDFFLDAFVHPLRMRICHNWVYAEVHSDIFEGIFKKKIKEIFWTMTSLWEVWLF